MSVRKVMVHPREKWVGLFILLAVVAILVLLTAQVLRLTQEKREYRIFVNAGDLVSAGAAITFKGLTAGDVRSVRIINDPEKLEAARVELLDLYKNRTTRRLRVRRDALRERLGDQERELDAAKVRVSRERKRRKNAKTGNQAPAPELSDVEYRNLQDRVSELTAETSRLSGEHDRTVDQLISAREFMRRLQPGADNPLMEEYNVLIVIQIRGREFIEQIREDAVLSFAPGFIALPPKLVVHPGSSEKPLPNNALIDVDFTPNLFQNLTQTLSSAVSDIKRDFVPPIKQMVNIVSDEIQTRPDTMMGKVKGLMDHANRELSDNPDSTLGLAKDSLRNVNDILKEVPPLLKDAGALTAQLAANRDRLQTILDNAALATRQLPGAASEGVKALRSTNDLLSGIKRIWPLSSFIAPDPYKRRTVKFVFRAGAPAIGADASSPTPSDTGKVAP